MNTLFMGLEPKEIPQALASLGSKEKQFSSGEFIALSGITESQLGILISGSANILKETEDGEQMMIHVLQSGDLFGEVFAALELEHFPISVQAAVDCKVAFLELQSLFLKKSCDYGQRILKNLLKILAQKNQVLSKKMSYLTHKTIRGRLLAYLRDQQNEENLPFVISLNRTQLAEYLAVDRSAMTRELAKMKKERLITYEKNKFIFYI